MGDMAAMAGNYVSGRELEQQEGSLWNTTYQNSLNYYRRDVGNEIKQADTDIKEARQDLKDTDVEFDKREKRERTDGLDDLRAKLNQIRLTQGAAKFESTTGHRGVMEGLSKQNLGVAKGNLAVKKSAEARQKRMEPIVKAKDIAQTAASNAVAASQGAMVTDDEKISKLVKAGVPEATAKKMLDILAR
jgi:hypothetical protein